VTITVALLLYPRVRACVRACVRAFAYFAIPSLWWSLLVGWEHTELSPDAYQKWKKYIHRSSARAYKADKEKHSELTLAMKHVVFYYSTPSIMKLGWDCTNSLQDWSSAGLLFTACSPEKARMCPHCKNLPAERSNVWNKIADDFGGRAMVPLEVLVGVTQTRRRYRRSTLTHSLTHSLSHSLSHSLLLLLTIAHDCLPALKDPSLRETAAQKKHYLSPVDQWRLMRQWKERHDKHRGASVDIPRRGCYIKSFPPVTDEPHCDECHVAFFSRSGMQQHFNICHKGNISQFFGIKSSMWTPKVTNVPLFQASRRLLTSVQCSSALSNFRLEISVYRYVELVYW